MPSVAERARLAIEPVLARLGLDLVDVELLGVGRARTLRLTVDRQEGIDLEVLSSVSQAVAPALDPVPGLDGPYALEVSSPGVERPLRRPDEFRRFLDTVVSVKTFAAVEGARRHRGRLCAADDEAITLEVDGAVRRLEYGEITQARTVFEWGAAPRPGKGAEGERRRGAGREGTP